MPFDDETVVASVRRTGRCVVIQEAQGFGGVGAEIASRVQERAFHALHAPVLRVSGLDVPYPAPKLEHVHLPGVDRVLDAIGRLQWDDAPDLRFAVGRCGMSVATALYPAVFLLPDLGEGLTEAEVMEWHVAVGDEVVVDQVVVTVETAKATVDLPCPHAGRVHQLHGEPGQLLAVGSPLLSVATAGSSRRAVSAGAVERRRRSAPATSRRALAQYREEEQAGSGAVLIGYGTAEAKRTRRRRVGAPAAPAPTATGCHGTGSRRTATAAHDRRHHAAVQVISPIVRRLARDHGIDLSHLTPGVAGRDPAPPRRGGGDRPVVARPPPCAHPPLRTCAVSPPPPRVGVAPPTASRHRRRAAGRCRGRPAHPACAACVGPSPTG